LLEPTLAGHDGVGQTVHDLGLRKLLAEWAATKLAAPRSGCDMNHGGGVGRGQAAPDRGADDGAEARASVGGGGGGDGGGKRRRKTKKKKKHRHKRSSRPRSPSSGSGTDAAAAGGGVDDGGDGDDDDDDDDESLAARQAAHWRAQVRGRFHIGCGRFDWDLPRCCVFLS
jgi:hypothetical protein